MRSSSARLLAAALILTTPGHGAPETEPVWTDPALATEEDPDFSIQGEYGSDDRGARWGLQVIARGDGKFDACLLEDGLPGLGWERGKGRVELSGERENGKVRLAGGGINVVIDAGNRSAAFLHEGEMHLLPRVSRKSPTLGAAPPEGAVVLFDGTSADAWINGKMDGDLLVNSDAISHRKFDDYTLHLEFRTPYKPFARGQKRGNSGVYHQGRYETQILDSFGLVGGSGDAGGIYSVAAPRLNACLPPLDWQTYDVDFTAPRWQDGEKISNARLTVRLNGVLIHEDQEVPHATAAAKFQEAPEPGPIYLQHHGNPVRFRNIWVVAKDHAATATDPATPAD